MADMQMKIMADKELVKKAQIKLKEKGLDLTSEFNKYLKSILEEETVEQADNNKQSEIKLLRFEDMSPKERERRMKIIKTKGPITEAMGVLKGMIWMADDFDAPLECMKDYMP